MFKQNTQTIVRVSISNTLTLPAFTLELNLNRIPKKIVAKGRHPEEKRNPYINGPKTWEKL